MPSFLAIAATLYVAYALTYLYAFVRNAIKARQTGFPSIYVPINQHFILFLLVAPGLRGWFEKRLPAAIFSRLTLCIYGWEFFQRLKPFEDYCGDQAHLKTFALVTCGRLEITTSHAEVIAQILSRPRDFQQVDMTTWFLGIFGSSVLTTDGDHWARQRKIVATVINERISKAVFDESIVQTHGLLDELAADQDADGRTVTNQLLNMAKKITINVLSGAGMGAPVDWNDNSDSVPKPGFKQTYIRSVKKVIECVPGPILLPIWFLDNYPSFLPGHKFMEDLSIAKKEFPIHTQDLLNKERARFQIEGSTSKNNILSQLLQASEHPLDGDTKGSKDQTQLSEEELVGNLFIFTSAGFDTTASTLSYSFALLARYPKWQDWVLEELDAILPTDPNDQLNYATIYPKAIRVMAFMFETLRLFTPLVHIAKQTRTEQTITTSTGTYSVPANTIVYINGIALHANPDLWRSLNAKPDEEIDEEDEWTFRPTRWIDPPRSTQPHFQPPKGAYIPWSMGPRVCPGQKMAQVEYTAIFLTLLRRHRIEAALLPGEGPEEAQQRLDRRLKDSVSILTIQMKDVYDVEPGDGKGLNLALVPRR